MNKFANNGVVAVVASACVAAIAGSGCSTPHVRAQSQQSAPVAVSSVPPVALPSTQVTEASLRVSNFLPVPGVKTIYFAFDSSSLSAASRTTLRANADFMKAHAGAKVRVSGYCDPRGTVEYNLALGQRRAQVVRDYYAKLGVPGDAIATISYGKANLACSAPTKACYAQCRRAVSEVALPQTAADSSSPSATPSGGDQ